MGGNDRTGAVRSKPSSRVFASGKWPCQVLASGLAPGWNSSPQAIFPAVEPAPGGELPLGLGREPLAGPLRVGEGVVPRDVDDRVVVLAVDRAAGPSGCRQLAPGTQRHQAAWSFERDRVGGRVKTSDPGPSRSSGGFGVPGGSSLRSCSQSTGRSAVVV